jgi:hypothetical protein
MKSLSCTHTLNFTAKWNCLNKMNMYCVEKREKNPLNNSIFGLMEFLVITCPSGGMREMKIEMNFSRRKWYHGILFLFLRHSVAFFEDFLWNMGQWNDDLVTSTSPLRLFISSQMSFNGLWEVGMLWRRNLSVKEAASFGMLGVWNYETISCLYRWRSKE